MKTHTILRKAQLRDAQALAALGRETFVETFGHLYTAENLNAYLAEAYSVEAHARDLADAQFFFTVAEAANAPAGFAKAGPCKLPVELRGEKAFELCRLYIKKQHQGQGIGAQFMETVIAEARARKMDTLYIGVWENNFGAQKFYKRYGAVEVGEYLFPVGAHLDRELIFKVTL